MTLPVLYHRTHCVPVPYYIPGMVSWYRTRTAATAVLLTAAAAVLLTYISA